ncbi:site-specific integrase [Paenibacillus agricola]|uniref:Site-specific integrase n=1 Tax=Paenibacillus agricola TaxID=2716264 RepID=A0ABX0JCJ5_9BACL|nr:site-specific integrase [Paenibacillus agricola]NHN33501.1 site-specific integrase [Paenibacillus agricola]
MQGYFRQRGCKCDKQKRCTCGATWSFTLDLGKDPITNKRKQGGDSGFKTKKEAEKACAEMITEFERGNLSSASSKITLAKFMAEFLENTIKNEVGKNTYMTQRGQVNNHIIPQLGHIKLQKLTPMDIQKFYSNLMGEGISPGTIQNIGNILGKTLRAAQEWGYVTKNVASVVKRPSYRPSASKPWNQEEMDTFLDKTRNSRFHAAYVIALTTGMRIGEICALNWDDVDLKSGIIQVNKTVVYADKVLFIKDSTKNGLSRNINIPNFVVGYLKKYKLEQKPNSLNLVVPGVKNEIVYNSAFRKTFKGDIIAAGVPEIKPHDMRHAHATTLLQSGENIKVVQERLGHTNVTTTLSTYSHVMPNMQKTLADNLEKSFNVKL